MNFVGFLEMEKEYLTTGWTIGKVMVSSLVPLTLYLLCLAFWKRSSKAGSGMIVAIAFMKTFWSVLEGGEAGTSVIVPAIVGLLLCVSVIYYTVRRPKKKILKTER